MQAPRPTQLSPYTHLDVWVNGGSTGGQTLAIAFYPRDFDFACAAVSLDDYLVGGAIAANAWRLAHVPLRDMGVDGASVSALAVVEPTGRGQPTVYLDDVALVTESPSGGTTPGPALTVDASKDRHPISPLIYGVNFAGKRGYARPFDASYAQTLGVTLNRWGGNATTRYNWQTSGTNLDADFFFENSASVSREELEIPRPLRDGDGSESDQFVEKNRSDGVASLVTVPAIGWVAKDVSNSTCGFSQREYGYAAQSFDTYTPNNTDCGDGVRASDRSLVTGNDPHDTSVAVGTSFVQQWVRHLVGKYGTANAGGVLFYELDNEPMTAERGRAALTVLVLNKDPVNALHTTLTVSGFEPSGAARVYRYSAANPNAIVRLADVAAAASVPLVLPSYSMTLLVFPSAARLKATVGLYDPEASEFYLRNTNGGGVADVQFGYGPPRSDWIPIAGDWDGDGSTTIGLYDPAASVFYLRNTNDAGAADETFAFGPPRANWLPLAGDWTGQGIATVGLYDPGSGTFYLRNAHAGGPADVTFVYGAPRARWAPLAGDWLGR